MNKNDMKNADFSNVLSGILAPLVQSLTGIAAAAKSDIPAEHRSMPRRDTYLNKKANSRHNGFPRPVSAKFNLEKAKNPDRYVLTSKVFFDDGTWVTVKNAPEDVVNVKTEKLSNGRVIHVATDSSKQAALAYAVVKRMFGNDVNYVTKEIRYSGIGRYFERVLKRSSDATADCFSDENQKSKSKEANLSQELYDALNRDIKILQKYLNGINGGFTE